MGKSVKEKVSSALIQLPFRCHEQMRMRLHRAIGKEMARTGQRISTNDLLVRLVDEGLMRMGES